MNQFGENRKGQIIKKLHAGLCYVHDWGLGFWGP